MCVWYRCSKCISMMQMACRWANKNALFSSLSKKKRRENVSDLQGKASSSSDRTFAQHRNNAISFEMERNFARNVFLWDTQLSVLFQLSYYNNIPAPISISYVDNKVFECLLKDSFAGITKVDFSNLVIEMCKKILEYFFPEREIFTYNFISADWHIKDFPTKFSKIHY